LGGAEIVRHCATAHSVETYRNWLDDPDCQLWIAEVAAGNAPVGFMVVAPAQLPMADLSDADLELKRIYILSRFHGGGLGKRFVQAAASHARSRKAQRLLLGVYAKNHAAIGFYERSGFAKVGTRVFNVGGKEYDDYIMGMALAA
jgi:ribosomal protein S18 acetylase RimI-like enzyme